MLDAITVVAAALEARATDAKGSRESVRALQRRRLADLVAHARTWSPLYADLYDGVPNDVRDPAALPIVTKPQLMAGFDDWVTDRMVNRAGVDALVGDLSRVGERYLGRYLVGTTSGTTGEPAIVLADAVTLAVSTGLAAVRRRQGVPARTSMRGGLRVALIIATGGHFMAAAETESFRRRSAFFKQRYHIFSVLAPMVQLVRELNAYQPSLLSGYATALVALAHEARAGRLHIRPGVVLSSAETLAAQDRALLAETFGAVVREVYGSSEVLHGAFECAHGTLHVNEEWAIFEPVDAQHRPVPQGTTSHTVLVTNLANRVQPVIRYDLGDAITVTPEPCACGSPLMGIRPQGRSDEVLALPARAGDEPVKVLPLALSTVVEETPGVTVAQVVHVPPDRLRIRFTTDGRPRDEVGAAIRDRVAAWLDRQGAAAVQIEPDDTPPARDPRSRKFRAVSVDRAAVAASQEG